VIHTSSAEVGTAPVLHFAASLHLPLTAVFHESVHVPAARAAPVPATAIANVAIAAITTTVKTILSAELGARPPCKAMSSILLIFGGSQQRA